MPDSEDNTNRVKRQKRPYSFACEACKTRKTKCSGPSAGQQACVSCAKAGRDCTYETKASKGITSQERKRLKLLESIVSGLQPPEGTLSRASAPPISPPANGNSIVTENSEISLFSTSEGPTSGFVNAPSLSPSRRISKLPFSEFPGRSNLPTTQVPDRTQQVSTSSVPGNSTDNRDTNSLPLSNRSHSDLANLEDFLLGDRLSLSQTQQYDTPDANISHVAPVTVDASGQSAHFGSTSHLHEPPPGAVPSHALLDLESERRALRANASLQRMWEQILYQSLKNEQEDGELQEDLLKTYWCWQAPTHLAVYRPLFVRDMALSGPYSSSFLVNVILAHACRYSTLPEADAKAERYLKKARLLLMEEMEKPTSIPTIQGLIILGGRECAVGRSSQGWLYTGMCIRMLKDMGIHLDGENDAFLKQLPAEEREARRRLFWSVYTWDKSISLALGRGPTFHESGGMSPAYIVDDSDDATLWEPHFFKDVAPASLTEYPPQPSYTALTFRSFCMLAEILNSILMQLYVSGPQRNASISTLRNIDARLAKWWTDLDPRIKIVNPQSFSWAPPPHILNVNLMNFTARILLFRPFVTSHDPNTREEAEATCTSCSKSISNLLLLHTKTFGFGNLIYLARYCVYVAATVASHDVKRSATEDFLQEAAGRLSLGLRALEAGSPQSPAFTKSLHILRRQLRNPFHDGGLPVHPSAQQKTMPQEQGALRTNANLAAAQGSSNQALPTVQEVANAPYLPEPTQAPSSNPFQNYWASIPLFPEQDSRWSLPLLDNDTIPSSQVEIPPMTFNWDFSASAL